MTLEATEPLRVLAPYPDALPTIHGITVSMHREAVALRSLGVDLRIAARERARRPNRVEVIDGVPVHRWQPSLKSLARESVRLGVPWFPDRYVHLEATALEPIIRAFLPHLLHVREPFGVSTGLALRRRFGVPFIASLHTFSPLYDRRLRRGRVVSASTRVSPLDALIAAQDEVSLFIAVSQDVARQHIAVGLDPSRIRVIPHGVPDAFFDARASDVLHRQFGVDPGDEIVLVVGRLEGPKGQADAIAAIAGIRGQHPRARLVLLGGGAFYEARDERELHRLAEAKGVADIVAIGSVAPDLIAGVMASAAVVVCPSREYEGFGLPAAEAAAVGRPVVAARVGALPEIVIDGLTGIVVPPSDPDALAAAIGTLLSDQPLRDEMGAAARQRATDYSMATCAGRYLAAYRSLVPGSGPA